MLKILLYIIACLASYSLDAQTFSGTGGPLPDTVNTCYEIPVSGIGTINGNYGLSKVCIDISHPLASDLEIILMAPDGTAVPLSLQNGRDGSDYAGTCFSADASQHIMKGVAPFAGIYDPQGYLGNVNNGQNGNGIWRLCIRDVKAADTGALRSWSLTFTGNPAPARPPCYNLEAAAPTCELATPVCNFNGFCGSTSSYLYTSHSWGGLNSIFCATIDNNSFISFIATSAIESFKIYITKSLRGGGLQLFFFSGSCGSGLLQAHGCYNQVRPGSRPTVITATDLIPGTKYYLMIDGYAGDDCEYTLTADSMVNFLNASPELSSICAGDSVTLTASGGDDIYKWSPATGLSSTSGKVVKAGPSISTIYTVSSVSARQCALTTQVTVNIKPVKYLGNDTAMLICPGNVVNLASVYNTNGLNAYWSLDGTPVNPVAVGKAGIYQLITFAATQCADTAFVTVSVQPSYFLGPDKSLTIASGDTVNLFKQYDTAGLSTNWTINGTGVLNPGLVTLPGIYRLIAFTNAGCGDTAFVEITGNSRPILGPDKIVHACTGIPVNLVALYDIQGLDAVWSFNGSQISNPAAISVAGVYEVVAINSAGLSDTAFITVDIRQQLNIGNDTTIVTCEGNPVNLSAAFNTAGLVTDWTTGEITLGNPAAIFTAGVYKLIAGNGVACSDTALAKIVIKPRPFLGPDDSLSICEGTKIQLSSLFPAAGLISRWTFEGTSVDPLQFISAAGNYRLIATNQYGCPDTASLQLNSYPNPEFTIKNPAPVCAPATVNLREAVLATGSPNVIYTYWTDSLATLSYSNAATAANGDFYIKGTDSNGCFRIAPVTVKVYPLPIVKAGQDTVICYGTYALLTGNVTNAYTPASYLWQTSTGVIAGRNRSITVMPLATSLYVLTAITDYGTCKFQVMDSLWITTLPKVAAFAGNDDIAMYNVPFQLNGSGGIRYAWSPAAVLDDPYIANPKATLLRDTKLVLKVTDSAGCIGYDTILVKALSGPGYYLPNAFSPNGDGLNDLFHPVAIGIRSTKSFRIFNRLGQQVFESQGAAKAWDGYLNGKKQPPGNYVWMIVGTGTNDRLIEMKGNVLLVK